MAKKLIVNADGFGFGPASTQGVIDAIKKGKFITSVSVNANFPEAERIQEFALKFPHISIGVHLNPLDGKPCLPSKQVHSLVGSDGFFHGGKFSMLLRKKRISMAELEVEFDAQISRIKEIVGDRLTHLDSQSNKHLSYFDLFIKLARKWDIQCMRTNAPLICLEALNPFLSRKKAYLRSPQVFMIHQYRRYQMWNARKKGIRMADALIVVGYAGLGNKTNPDNWRKILHNLPEGTFEIYCHPAYPDEAVRRWSGYQCEEREEELRILSEKWFLDIAKESGVELINFSHI